MSVDNYEKITMNQIKDLFQEYYAPTISTPKGPSYVKKLIENICKKLDLKYNFEGEILSISSDNYKSIKQIFINRKLQYENPDYFYSKKEVLEKINVSDSHITKLIRRKALSVATIVNGQYFFMKEDIDKIVSMLEDSYGISEIVESVRKNTQHSNIEKHNVRNYIKRYLKPIDNPIDNYDLRIRKKDLSILLKYIEENYKKRKDIKKRGDISHLLEKYKPLKYIKKSSSEIYLDKEWFVPLIRSHLRIKSWTKYIPHIVSVCNNMKIDWFTNKNHNNIFILKEDQKKYEKYYEIRQEVYDNCQSYYDSDEVSKIFGFVANPIETKVATMAEPLFVDGKYYYPKKKIDELYYIHKNTISFVALAEELEVGLNKIVRIIDKHKIKYLTKEEVPLGNENVIYNFEADIIRKYVMDQKKFKELTPYEQYQSLILNTDNIGKIPKTIKEFDRFVIKRINSNSQTVKALVYVYKNIISTLDKEIMDCSNAEVDWLINMTKMDIEKKELSNFLNICKKKHRTKYNKKFIFEGNSNKVYPYTSEQWVQFYKYIFHDMFTEISINKAVNDRMYSMSWLYCALHYVSVWRTSDYINKLPIPNLEQTIGMNEYELIDYLKINKNFTESMSQKVVNDITQQIKIFGLKPSKTESSGNEPPNLKLVVNTRYVRLIGLLLALCEAHRRIMENKNELNRSYKTLITERATRGDVHVKVFGRRYTEIFGEEGFKNLKACKTHLTSFQQYSQRKKLGMGHHISSMLRSHKVNTKNGIADSTQIYLEYNSRNNSIDEITNCLIERGTFGFIPYTLLKMAYEEEFTEIDMKNQNNIIKQEIGMFTPLQIEKMVEMIAKRKEQSILAVRSVVSNQKQAKEVLKIICNGQTPAKTDYSQCLLKTIKQSECVMPRASTCIGCSYHIQELYFLLEFNKRFNILLENINNAKHEFDKYRYSKTLMDIYLPILVEAISFFGKERVRAFIDTSGINREMQKLKNENKLTLLLGGEIND